MTKHELKTTYHVIDHPSQLSQKEHDLLAAAKDALANSYSPYSHFKVGAAALMENGAIINSSNYENASYPLSVCAEHSALITAANHFPEIPVVALAITVKNPNRVIDRPALPCGSCRQVICETENRNDQAIKLILQGETGPVYIFENGESILPMAFTGDFL